MLTKYLQVILIMSRKKNLVYVGGLEDSVTEELLFAAFIPFGEIKSVQIMKDYVHSTIPFSFDMKARSLIDLCR